MGRETLDSRACGRRPANAGGSVVTGMYIAPARRRPIAEAHRAKAPEKAAEKPADKGTPKLAASAPVATGTAIALAGKPDVERKPSAEAKGDNAKSGNQAKSSDQAKIFVSPRAPDDPGPDAGSAEDIEPVIPRYGTNN